MRHRAQAGVVVATILALGAGGAMAGGKPMQSLGNTDGATVEVVGRIAKIPHAHPIQPKRGQAIQYVDLAHGPQIVVYGAKRIDCEGPVRLRGKVLRLEARAKGGKEKTFVTYQLDVDAWECLGEPDAPPAPCQGQAGGAQDGPCAEALLDLLGRPDVPLDRKQALKREIVARGKAAIPVLIAHLDDGHVYEYGRDVQNYYGMRADQSPPPPLLANISVGSEARELLYDIITPRYQSPHAKPIKPYSASMFLVKDWPAWWAKHQHESLAEIHKALEPLVDRYWQSHGTSQEVP